MSFARSRTLFHLILPMPWMQLNWGKSRRGAWCLMASLIAVLLATSEPQFTLRNSRASVTLPADVPANLLRNRIRLLDLNSEQEATANVGVRADPADPTFPPRVADPSAIPSSCFVLVLEKSRSMSSTQMELAQLSALEIVENLSRDNLVGVLAFDDAPHWPVPIRSTNDRTSIDDRIEAITPGGGTRIAAALHEALRQILSTNAISKHIVLITDGRSRDRDSLSLATEARALHVTITAVGLVDDVNHDYLAKLARSAAGHVYLIREPWDVEQTMFRDAMAYRAQGNEERKSGSMVPVESKSLPPPSSLRTAVAKR